MTHFVTSSLHGVLAPGPVDGPEVSTSKCLTQLVQWVGVMSLEMDLHYIIIQTYVQRRALHHMYPVRNSACG